LQAIFKERSARLINPEYSFQGHHAQALEILDTYPFILYWYLLLFLLIVDKL